MVDRVVIEVARRNLQAAAGLDEAAFWREYAAIEDAAQDPRPLTDEDVVEHFDQRFLEAQRQTSMRQ